MRAADWTALVVALCVLPVVQPVWADELEWASSFGGPLEESATRVAVGTDGAVVSIGFFSGTADFDPGSGTFNLTAEGASNLFVSKLDSAGRFLWARALKGAVGAASVAADGNGNVIVSGDFDGTSDFDPGPGTSTLTGTGVPAMFVFGLLLLCVGFFPEAIKVKRLLENTLAETSA